MAVSLCLLIQCVLCSFKNNLLSTNFPANGREGKNNMACNIGVTAAGHFPFIEAANQGGANDSENYIVVDSKGGPMI